MMWYWWNVSYWRSEAAQYRHGVLVHTTATVCECIWRMWLPGCCTHCHWDRWGGSSLCYCFLSMCVHVGASLSSNGKLISVLFTLTSLRIRSPFYRRGRWHLHRKWVFIWKTKWQAEKERARCLLRVVFLPCLGNAWCNQTLCSQLSCEWNAVIFSKQNSSSASIFICTDR